MTSEFTLQLLPGDHWLTDNYGWSDPIHFSVGSDGTVSYDAALSGIFSGGGTKILTLNGETLQIDAAALRGTTPYLTLATLGGLATDQVETVTILPGTFQFTAGPDQYIVTLSAQDSLDYDPSLDGALSGRGTNRLTIVK